MPFSFLSTAVRGTPRPPKPVLVVQAMPDRANLRIEFPRVVGYRYEMPAEHLTATFDGSSILALSTQEVPTSTELDPIVGKVTTHDLKLDDQRLQTVVYAIAKRTLDNHFRDESGAERPWLYPQLVAITRRWIDECVTPYLKDHAYPQMLLLAEYSHAAADRIYQAIVAGHRGEKRLLPVLRPYEAIGSTDDVWFETTKPCFDSVKSHLNRTVLDSGWEMKLASVLEEMPEVVCYAKNQHLNLKVPYTFEGRAANYVPDYLIRLDDPAATGDADLLTLVLEVSGEARKDKQAKVATAQHLWVPAVNNWGGLGRWAFLEITDPWDAENLMRTKFLSADAVEPGVSRG